MATNYKGFDIQESNDHSDVDIEEGSPQPGYPQASQAVPQYNQQYAQYPQINPVNVLQGPGYRIVQAQTQVSKWAWYIKIFAYICIVFGVMKTVGGILQLLNPMSYEFEVMNDQGYEEVIHLPEAAILLACFLDSLRGIVTLVTGLQCLKAVKQPTRFGTWMLFKRVVWLQVLYFVLITVIYILVFGAFATSLAEWVDNADIEDGEYNFKHKATGHEINMRKNQNNEDFDERVGITAIILTGMFIAFLIGCCMLTACTACVLGGLYKFHITTKELDLVQENSPVQMHAPQPMQQMSYHPQAISLGQVVQMQ
jgi:hypothetical protein